MYRKDKNVDNRAYKFRLYPNAEQIVLINKTFGCVRFIHNNLLSDKIKHYKATGKSLKKEVSEYKEIYPFLYEVDSLALANAKVIWKPLIKTSLHILQNFQSFIRKGCIIVIPLIMLKTILKSYSVELNYLNSV